MSEQLALLGGPRTVEPGAAKPWPIITSDTYKGLSDVLDSGVFHTLRAPQTEALMAEFATFCGVNHAVVTNSGTSALHMCVAAAGLEPGDEIILPAYTYWATAAGCLHGLTIPVFVDIDPETYTMDPAKIEGKVDPERTKAIMPVHINGMPADMDPLNEVAKRHNLIVLADACQAAGAEYRQNGVWKKAGGLCDAEGFSLNRSKTVSGCEGGIYCTNNDDFYDYAVNMTSFGVRDIGEASPASRSMLGWMYRPLEFVSAFTREQLSRADGLLAQRRQMADLLTEALHDIPGLAGPVVPDNRKPCYFTYVLTFVREEIDAASHLTDRVFMDRASAAMRAEGLPLGSWQNTPLPAMPIFEKKQGFGRNYPWAVWDDWQARYAYDPDEFPATLRFLDTHCNLGGVYPPNDEELMHQYLVGMRKVMSQPEAWVDYKEEA